MLASQTWGLGRADAGCAVAGFPSVRNDAVVEVDRLSFFEPWPDLGPHHENQLTRAFLVVLRMCPLAHQVWLRLVAPDDPALDLARLPSPELHTQRATITRAPAPGEAEALPMRGISVLQSADPEPVNTVVGKSERHGIFDGVIVYGDQLAIVLEVKFVPPASLHEVLQINVGDARVELDEHARTVNWRELLDAWGDAGRRVPRQRCRAHPPRLPRICRAPPRAPWAVRSAAPLREQPLPNRAPPCERPRRHHPATREAVPSRPGSVRRGHPGRDDGSDRMARCTRS